MDLPDADGHPTQRLPRSDPRVGGTQGVPADSLHEISVQISNQGNREVTLTPIERSLPGMDYPGV